MQLISQADKSKLSVIFAKSYQEDMVIVALSFYGTINDNTLISISKSFGLNITQWGSDWQSEAVMERLSTDVNLGYELGIRGTPSVCINGRQVIRFQEPILAAIIQNELNTVSN